ncbi:hypothetical protein Tco_0670336 [Tanacetum coccineum]
MLEKTPNTVYDPFLKDGLGYKNFKRLKKAIATQPKMYDGEKLHSTKLVINSLDSEETLEDVENLKELREELIEEVQEMLNIFESVKQKVDEKSSKENILQNMID